jgi:serine protease AprX
MARRNVVAFGFTADALETAQARLDNAVATEAFVYGEIDEELIGGLEAEGLVVEVVERAPPDAARGLESRTGGSDAELPTALGQEPWREQLDALGVELLESLPDQAYSARIGFDRGSVDAIRGLAFVERLEPFGAAETTTEGVRSRALELERAGAEIFDVRLHDARDLDGVLAWLAERGVEVVGSRGRKVRVSVDANDPDFAALASHPAVAELQRYVEPELFNDRARVLLGLDPIDAPASAGRTGAGQVVGVADTGLDEAHPDFQGRIAGVTAWGRPGDPSDPHGHGTHVAGSAVGDGAASNGALRGAAPDAEWFFQSLLDARGRLGGLPLDLGDLFQEAYDAGARVHNNSWGAATASLYTMNSTEVDEFVDRNRDMLLVFAAGNEGTAFPRFHSAVGFVDWASLGSPATAKNALTVGASRSDRHDGGLSQRTYGDVWRSSFPDPPMASTKVSGDPQGLAAFSSRGPCDDRRIKPDLVAPGTDVVSAKSSAAPTRNFWGTYAPDPGRYGYMGGTSMAAPLVAGCAALVRRYYQQERGHEPSAALLKATLINGTRWLAGDDAIADHADLPNYHQGFGALHMPLVLPDPQAPSFRLAFLDDWKDADLLFRFTGQRFAFRFDADGESELRLCLAYTDRPGRSLQNQLHVTLEAPDPPRILRANENRQDVLGAFDRNNNVQVIRIAQARPGRYVVRVDAENLLRPGQDFALVVAGAVGDLVRTA